MIGNIESIGIIIFDDKSIILLNNKAKQLCKNIEQFNSIDLHNIKNSTQLVNSDGNLYDCKIFCKSLFEISDTKYLMEIIDISELKKTKEYIDLIIENSFDGFFDWDIEKKYEYMSPRFWKMFGYEPHEKKHDPEEWKAIIFQEDLQLMLKNFDEHVKSKGAKDFSQKVRYTHKNGSTVYVNCTGKVIEWSSDGKPLRMVGTHINITDFVLQNEKLNNVELEKKTAEETLKVKMKLVNYIFHEVRNPLHALSAGIDIIESMLHGPELSNIIDIMKKSIQKSTKILNDTLDYSKLEDGSIKLNIKNTNISNLLESVVQFYKLKAKTLSLKIFTDIERDLYSHVDKDKFEQIISNILSNSMKFTRPLGTIFVILEKINNDIKCTIEDTGCGIDEENIEYITEPYNCVSASYNNSGVRSIGIGLSIVKKLLILHNSNIEISSKKDKGTKISFLLKISEKDNTEESDNYSLKKMNKSNKNIKILLVDDDTDNNIIMHKLLTGLNYTVEFYTDGSEVINNIDKLNNFNIILLDHLMKNMNGDEVLEKIRNIYKGKIVVLTGCTTDDIKKNFYKFGADKIFEKPVIINELINYIDE